MKITLLGPVHPYRGGIAHYTSHLARKLIAGGFATQTISFRRQYPAWLYPGKSDKDSSANPLTVPAKYLLDPFFPWTWWQTAHEIQAFAPDIVVIQWWTTFWAPAFAFLSWTLKQKGVRVIFLIHNVLPHEEKPWDRYLTKAALSNGIGFITQTKCENERLNILLPNSQALAIPHPIYNELEKPSITKTEARQIIRFPDNKIILLIFGIVRKYKGLDILLEAISLLPHLESKLLLVVAGEFWEKKEHYLSQIKALGIGDRVRIEDRYLPDEEAALFFSASDVLVAPYIGGTQSGVINLGFGFGIPMIISDKIAAGIPTENRRLVTIVSSGNSHQLAMAIEGFVQNHETSYTDPQVAVNPDDGWNDLIQGIESFATPSSSN
jgi:D-inositol-3-phosphate glycosyltransferase